MLYGLPSQISVDQSGLADWADQADIIIGSTGLLCPGGCAKPQASCSADLENADTDQAVDDIAAHEADTMLAVQDDIKAAGLRSRMLLQVHDELVFEVAAGELEQLREIAAAAMAGAYGLSIPLEVSMGTGRSWAEAAH